MLNLHASGVSWALPLGVVALCAFATTQITQYVLIRFVYGSGDLAAIPWAFQSSAVLSRTGLRALAPKLLKRDFVVTLMLVFAALGRLDLILIAFRRRRRGVLRRVLGAVRPQRPHVARTLIKPGARRASLRALRHRRHRLVELGDDAALDLSRQDAMPTVTLPA